MSTIAGCALLLESAALNKACPGMRHARSSSARQSRPLQARRQAQEDEDYVEVDDEDGWSQVRLLYPGRRVCTLRKGWLEEQAGERYGGCLQVLTPAREYAPLTCC